MADPVSWLLIEPGWQVVDGDGNEVGLVDEVRGDQGSDIFDGLMVRGSALTEPRYVSADDVVGIVDGRVTIA